MNENKEFEQEWERIVPNSTCQSRNFEKAYAEIFWNHQQKIIEQKNKEINDLRNFICPLFVSDNSGYVSCSHDKDQEIQYLKTEKKTLNDLLDKKDEEIKFFKLMDESYKLNWAGDRGIINKLYEDIKQKNKEIELHFDFIVDNNLESKFNHWVNEQALSEVEGER